MAATNTIGTGTYGSAYRSKRWASFLQQVLRKATVAEAICAVDRSGSKYITNPYIDQPVAAQQALAGTYSVSGWTITDETLTITDEHIYGTHIADFEDALTQYDLKADRRDNMAYAIAYSVDKFVLNCLCEDGTGAYTTAAGGFSATNWPTILANIVSKTSGYAEAFNGRYIVLEASDLVGVILSQAGTGFNFADAVNRNGWIGNQLGVDIYVVADGTFVSSTLGTRSDLTNSGHRVAGVKRVATYAIGRPVYEEKMVTGKTGVELAYGMYSGFKQWTQTAVLTIDITVTS